MAHKYIFIDSSYRNRKEFPYTSSFIIRFQENSASQNPLNYQDPVVDAYPYFTGGAPGGTITNPILTGGSTVNNFYIGNILETNDKFRTITAYDGTTQTATLSSPFDAVPGLGPNWKVRKELPFEKGFTLDAGSTVNNVVLNPSTYGTYNDILIGKYVYIPSTGESSIIQQYDSTTRTATVYPPFSIAFPIGEPYEILSVSRDNAFGLRYFNSIVSSSELVCYEICLSRLIVPNTTLASGNGGTILNYPYLMVELSNLSAPQINTIYANNPYTEKVLFIVPLDDDAVQPTFAQLKSCDMKQTVKFKPNDQLKFTVYLPNGEILKYASPETFSPLPANPTIQISAVFQITRLNSNVYER